MYSLTKVSAAWPSPEESQVLYKYFCPGVPSTMWSSCDCSCDCINLINLLQSRMGKSGGWGHQTVKRENLNLGRFQVIEQSQHRWIHTRLCYSPEELILRFYLWFGLFVFWNPEQRLLTWYSIELSSKRKWSPPGFRSDTNITELNTDTSLCKKWSANSV